jgi:SAM-dependent methyltransferase
MDINNRAVQCHWLGKKTRSVGKTIRNALLKTGKDPDSLTQEDFDLLCPLDEFHSLGSEATVELARLLELEKDARVLDVGCGIGGPSRRLAIQFGCRVTGLDLIKEYYEVAVNIAERMRLSHQRVDYHHGDALDMPFGDRSFDIVWIQVASTNIADRAKLYSEMYRVLKLGGRVGIFDIFAGPGGPIHFPVPWAYDESTSALLSPENTERELERAGLRVVNQREATCRALDWFRDQAIRMLRPGGPPPLGFHVLLPDWAIMAINQVRNLIEQRILVGYRVLKRM